MKKLLTLLLLPLLFGGCELGDEDESHTEIWTVASEKGVAGIAMDFGHTPAYIVKKGSAAAWEIFSGSIVGFTFEKGYESTIRVRIDAIADPPADGPGRRYTMKQLISRTQMQSAVDPLQFSPEFDVTIASRRADSPATSGYWFKDMRYPIRVGSRSRGRSKASASSPASKPASGYGPVAEYDDTKGDYEVKYYQTGLISSEEKASEDIPE